MDRYMSSSRGIPNNISSKSLLSFLINGMPITSLSFNTFQIFPWLPFFNLLAVHYLLTSFYHSWEQISSYRTASITCIFWLTYKLALRWRFLYQISSSGTLQVRGSKSVLLYRPVTGLSNSFQYWMSGLPFSFLQTQYRIYFSITSLSRETLLTE